MKGPALRKGKKRKRLSRPCDPEGLEEMRKSLEIIRIHRGFTYELLGKRLAPRSANQKAYAEEGMRTGGILSLCRIAKVLGFAVQVSLRQNYIPYPKERK